MAVPSGPAVALGRRVRARCLRGVDLATVVAMASPRPRELVARGSPHRRNAIAAPPRQHNTKRNAGPRRTNEDAFHEGGTLRVYDGHSGDDVA